MYDQAQQQRSTLTGAGAGRLDAMPATAVEQPALHALCDRLEQQLGAMMEGVRRAQQFSHRLLDPRPEKISKDQSQATPPAPTVESRLRSLVRAAETINGELHNVAADLERAA